MTTSYAASGRQPPRSIGVGIHRQAVRLGFRLAYHSSSLGGRYRELERSQWQPRNQLLDDQWRRLQQLVRHAYAQVPFYRMRMQEAGIHPDRLETVADYQRLPVLTRDDLRAHKEELVALSFPRRRLIANGSGGSTGAPVPFYHDRSHVVSSKAAKLRNFRWVGWEPGDAWARLWGSNFDVAPHQQLRGRIWERLTRVRWLSCFELSEADMDRYARELAVFQPDVIEAYVNPLYLFCRFLRARGLVGSIRPRGVILSAETLYDYHRAEIEEVLGCRVFNRYGCREVGDIAHECPAGRMHLNAETVFTEFLVNGQPAAPEQAADIVVTPLDLYGMPMLRYRVEDIGSAADGMCACGRSLPLMHIVQGRVQDLIVTRSGRHLTGVFFAHLLKELDVRQFQVVQDTIDELEFSIMPGPDFGPRQLEYVEKKLREYTSGELQLRIHLTNTIPPSPSGKHRVTLSRVLARYAPQSEDFHAN